MVSHQPYTGTNVAFATPGESKLGPIKSEFGTPGVELPILRKLRRLFEGDNPQTQR